MKNQCVMQRGEKVMWGEKNLPFYHVIMLMMMMGGHYKESEITGKHSIPSWQITPRV